MHPSSMIGKQFGMTMTSWLLVLGVAVFFLLIGIKMVPTYLENYSIRQVLQNMENDRAVRKMTPGEIRQSFMKRLKINSVYEFERNAIKIKKEKSGNTSIVLDYEVRKPVAGNVAVVMTFNESAQIAPP